MSLEVELEALYIGDSDFVKELLATDRCYVCTERPEIHTKDMLRLHLMTYHPVFYGYAQTQSCEQVMQPPSLLDVDQDEDIGLEFGNDVAESCDNDAPCNNSCISPLALLPAGSVSSCCSGSVKTLLEDASVKANSNDEMICQDNVQSIQPSATVLLVNIPCPSNTRWGEDDVEIISQRKVETVDGVEMRCETGGEPIKFFLFAMQTLAPENENDNSPGNTLDALTNAFSLLSNQDKREVLSLIADGLPFSAYKERNTIILRTVCLVSPVMVLHSFSQYLSNGGVGVLAKHVNSRSLLESLLKTLPEQSLVTYVYQFIMPYIMDWINDEIAHVVLLCVLNLDPCYSNIIESFVANVEREFSDYRSLISGKYSQKVVCAMLSACPNGDTKNSLCNKLCLLCGVVIHANPCESQLFSCLYKYSNGAVSSTLIREVCNQMDSLIMTEHGSRLLQLLLKIASKHHRSTIVQKFKHLTVNVAMYNRISHCKHARMVEEAVSVAEGLDGFGI